MNQYLHVTFTNITCACPYVCNDFSSYWIEAFQDGESKYQNGKKQKRNEKIGVLHGMVATLTLLVILAILIHFDDQAD